MRWPRPEASRTCVGGGTALQGRTRPSGSELPGIVCAKCPRYSDSLAARFYERPGAAHTTLTSPRAHCARGRHLAAAPTASVHGIGLKAASHGGNRGALRSRQASASSDSGRCRRTCREGEVPRQPWCPPAALLERSLDATAPRSRVKCCTSGPSHSTPFPARRAQSRGAEFGPGKLLGTRRLACASVYLSRTVHETQGLAAGAFLQRALSSVKNHRRTHGRGRWQEFPF